MPIINGTSSANTLNGTEEADQIDGLGGNDTINGAGGDDYIIGGSGNDSLTGGTGNDVFAYVSRGFGNDVVTDFASADRIDLAFLGIGDFSQLQPFMRQSGLNTIIEFGYGSDTETITLQNVSLASLTASSFIFNTSSAALNVTGGVFNDVLFGGNGADTINGGDRTDTINAGAGNDYIIGGSGNDTLTGGPGNDVFGYLSRYFGNDVVTDFGSADRIDLAFLGIGDFSQLQPFMRQSGLNTIIEFGYGSDTETITLQNVSLTSLTASNFIFNTSSAALNVIGGVFNDVLFGGNGADTIDGGSRNDVLSGGAGNDSLNGGTGFDVALYSGVRRQYTASSTSVSGNGEGTDTLTGIEEVRFVDGVLTFDATSQSAQVMRLYSATLNRTPDQAGLEGNVALFGTFGLQGLANAFVASAEFQNRFGALNNQQFVEQMYVFALGRTGDPAGINGWVSLLNSGTTRGQVVVGFSESAENVGRTAATLNAGLWVPDQQALIIARMYDATFDRLPDVGGLTGWVNALKAGTPLVDIAAAFAGSAEFVARYGALSNQAFVEQLYRFCLDREGDPAGIAGWVATLNSGTSRASVLAGFSESPEHIALTAPFWSGGIRFAGFVGAPVEDQSVKGIDDAQVLPGSVDTDGLDYDPADFGLTSLFDKADDAFVLPATPDSGLQPWIPAVNDDTGLGDFGLDLFRALDVTTPYDEGLFLLDIALTLPTDLNTDDLSFGFQKGGHELNWA